MVIGSGAMSQVRACGEVLEPYRPHRALGQLTPAQAGTQPPEPIDLAGHRIRRKQVLGGLTHEYYVAALQSHAATERRRSPTRIVFPSPTGTGTLTLKDANPPLRRG